MKHILINCTSNLILFSTQFPHQVDPEVQTDKISGQEFLVQIQDKTKQAVTTETVDTSLFRGIQVWEALAKRNALSCFWKELVDTAGEHFLQGHSILGVYQRTFPQMHSIPGLNCYQFINICQIQYANRQR